MRERLLPNAVQGGNATYDDAFQRDTKYFFQLRSHL